MSANWKRPLISAHERDIRELLEEIRAADDCDLWEEAVAKLNDVLVVYREAMKARAVPGGDDPFLCAFIQAFTEVLDPEP